MQSGRFGVADRFSGLVLAVLLALVHCGGRAAENAPGHGSGNAATAATASTAQIDAGGAPGDGGVASAVNGGGSAGAAMLDAGDCGGEFDCASGSRLLTLPGDTCPSCVSPCASNFGYDVGCAVGRFVDVPPPDLCSTICEVESGEGGASDEDSCAEATSAYDTYRASLLSDDVLACDTDLDCGLVNPMLACGSNCAFAVNRQHPFDVTDALNDRAEELCSHCESPSPRVCPALAWPLCRDHRCVLGGS
jgi:hypothetical protein